MLSAEKPSTTLRDVVDDGATIINYGTLESGTGRKRLFARSQYVAPKEHSH